MSAQCQSIVVWRPLLGFLANSVDPDQTPRSSACDNGLHCLQIVKPILSSDIQIT